MRNGNGSRDQNYGRKPYEFHVLSDETGSKKTLTFDFWGRKKRSFCLLQGIVRLEARGRSRNSISTSTSEVFKASPVV